LVALVLPWINPFASSPSTNVIPLLLSWMMSACLVLAVTDLPVMQRSMSRWGAIKLGIWFLCLGALLLFVPAVIDHAVTVGLGSALVCIVLMVYAGRRFSVPNNQVIPYLAWAWLVAALINAVIGLLQYLDVAQALTPWVNIPFYKGDAFGNLRQRNQYASLMSIGWVALWWWVAARAAHFQTVLARIGLALGLALLATGAAISISRTGMLQWMTLSVLSLLWCALRQRQHHTVPQLLWWFSGASPVVFVLASLIMPLVAQYVTAEPGASLLVRVAGGAGDYQMCGGRGVLWSNVATMIAQHPWLGWGWAQADYAHFETLYAGMRFCDMLDNAHDLPLHIALELGVPFAVLSVLLALGWVWQRRPWMDMTAHRAMGWGVLVVLIIHSLLEYPLWYGPFQMALGLALGLIWDQNSRLPMEKSGALAPVQPDIGLTALACALFVGCLYAAWDFNRVSQIYKAPQARDWAYRDDPMGVAQKSWLFKNQADFAWLTTHEVTAENAQEMNDVATRLLRYSPEERVVTRLIRSKQILGQQEQAAQLQIRLEAMQASLQMQKKDEESK
jgi:hypothetical protein